MSPAKHSSANVTDGQTDGRMDGQTTDKAIPMCRYASQATQKREKTLQLQRGLKKEISDYLINQLKSD